MQLRYQYRLYPDGDQRAALARQFGCERMVINDALERVATVKASNQRLGSPKARIADRSQPARFTANARWKITGSGKPSLPRIGEVKVRWSRDLRSAPTSVTVIKDSANPYFASFVVETNACEVLPETTPEVGIDLGLTHFAVLSDGRGRQTAAPAPGRAEAVRREHHPAARPDRDPRRPRRAGRRFQRGAPGRRAARPGRLPPRGPTPRAPA